MSLMKMHQIESRMKEIDFIDDILVKPEIEKSYAVFYFFLYVEKINVYVE
jgi:hypothetical protein